MLVCGVDEAGRGPLAGSVIAAAVILDPNEPIAGLRDSKKLSAKRREQLYSEIIAKARAYAIAEASVAEIDSLNILAATMLAMHRAVEQLSTTPTQVLIDGNRVPATLTLPAQAIVGGDDLVPEIAAASILAKVTRDQQLILLDNCYPEYGFAKHKGYGTKQHLAALARYGAIAGVHRQSFAPVKQSQPASLF